MQFSADVQTALIATLGETITLSVTVGEETTTTPLVADYRLESTPLQMFDGSVVSSSPVARITAAVKAANSIDYGSTLICRSITYTVADLRQEQSGLWLLILTKG